MNDSHSMTKMHKFDIVVNTLALTLALLITMAALTNWVIKMYPPADPLVSILIALVNGVVGAIFFANGKTWATQLSGFTHHNTWSNEQVKLALIAAVLIAGTFGAAWFGLMHGTSVDKVFGIVFLFLPLPLARLARNAINSRGIADQQRPTVYES